MHLLLIGLDGEARFGDWQMGCIAVAPVGWTDVRPTRDRRVLASFRRSTTRSRSSSSRDMCAKDCTENEFLLLMQLAKTYQLDPFGAADLGGQVRQQPPPRSSAVGTGSWQLPTGAAI